MITCPECGQQASDDAKFCDRCGQGLSKAAASASQSPARPTPLTAGTSLKGGIEIVGLTGQTSIENRYRARRIRDGRTESIALRERLGPQPSAESAEVVDEAPHPAAPEPPATRPEDANGPSAKTAELRPAVAQTNGTASPPQLHASSSQAGESASANASGEGIQSAVDFNADPGPASTVMAGAATNSSADEATEAAIAAIATEAQPNPETDDGAHADAAAPGGEDLGEVFGRVLALSQTINHPAFQRATEGFAENGRVYLVYADEELKGLRRGSGKMTETEAIAAAIQVCQAISFVHRRALRLNDICPESVAVAPDGRLKLTGLDYVSNDNELQGEPIFNDGYTAPEIYRGKKVDKRADIFSAGAILYTWLTGARIPSESWREEAGPVQFYPPHVVTPRLENAIRRAIAFGPADRWPTIDEFKAELIALGGTFRLRAAAMTDVGRVREHNEDAVLAVEYTRESLVDPAQSHLYVVADGMGGAEAGEIAAAIAVQTIRSYIETRLEGARGEVSNGAELLTSALEEANSRIIEYVASHPESRGTGSTGVCALLAPPDAAVAWVGDSRGYLMEGATLRQVTKDHSLVQRLIEIGQITAEEAHTHEHKNVITRSLGARQSGPAGAEAVSLKLKRGDKLMLCSDGLTAHVDDRQIHDILGRNPDPFDAARELIVAANAGGGTDNITVIVVYAS
ncbi:Stp1/IreP family PP2C-type Ser/Thr phosphatase [Candidatus Binatus sp.]|uniref:Stp1/IreP family PP2C-type Ser/Thr phosphatase n=1 Tax=Candidatus Binatus sp. TaxID=2811406 RepID=UPI003C582E64